jgi:glycosyltransferase involved in cell wall biosynthesis
VSRLGSLRLVRQGASRIDRIDGFRAPSTHVKENYAELGYPAENISVIPHPLNDAFLVEHESDFEEPYRLLYVGFLEMQKGVDKLVPILSGLRENLDQTVTLTIVGDGGLRSKMERQAANRGVEDAVDFRGFVPNEQLPPIYASHDVFVYPGIWEEPLARVYLEALATGTPIVTTQYGSIDSIVGSGGLITDGGSKGFVDIISRAVSENRLSNLSRNAKSKSEEYRLDHVLEKIEEMYLRHTT